MDTTLENFCNALDELANAVTNSYGDDRTMQEILGRQFPLISRHDLADIPRQLASQIRALKPKKISAPLIDRLNVFRQRLHTLQAKTVPFLFKVHGDDAMAHAYLQTLECMRIALGPILEENKFLNSGSLAFQKMMEEAQSDLEQIKTKKESVDGILKTQEAANVATLNKLEEMKKDADGVMQKLGLTEQAAVNQSLGQAFQKRGKVLLWRSRGWIVVLFVALVVTAYLGHQSMGQLQIELSKSVLQWSVVWMHIFLSIFNIGAPLWLAWLATIQIQKYFLLNEDYAFKATVAATYEGYRREAYRLDEALEKRLFDSALKRLDEHPLRLLEKKSHSSPFHALLNGFIGRRELHEKQKLSATDTAEA